MFTRRQALQLAAAATATAEAARLLAEPAEFDPSGRSRGMWFADGAAPEYAEYKQALDAVAAIFPGWRDAGCHHPIHRLDEAAHALWTTAWMAGVRAGAAYEHLRLALAAPQQTCRRCQGNGTLWDGVRYHKRPVGAEAEACPECGGRGWVPTPAPRLDLAAG